MDFTLNIAGSPHIKAPRTTRKIMLNVIIALLPTLLAGGIIFGKRAFLVVITCIAAAVVSEYIFNLIVKKEQTTDDLTAVVTGLLLGLNLPVSIPVWQCIIGSVFATVVVKGFFGGLGKNIVNPAITARVFMLIAFSSVSVAGFGKGVDAVSGATPLVELATGGKVSITSLFLGTVGGAIGETCKLTLLIGFVYLLITKVITWHIPICYIGSAYVFTLLFTGFDFYNSLLLILSGGLFIGAIFMATDYVTSPPTPLGKVIFGIGAGFLTVVIRFYSNYPEGVSFAILLMNILSPYIEKATAKKLFGGNK